jgi:lysophospholipase L1-like esterase
MKIVAFGDSIAYGWDVAEKYSYRQVLKRLLEKEYPDQLWKIYNRGVPGDTALGGLNRVKRDVGGLKPDLVFVGFGLNDAQMALFNEVLFSPSKYKEYMKTIIDYLRNDLGCEVWLLTTTAVDEDNVPGEYSRMVGALNQQLTQLSEEEGIKLVDLYSPLKAAGFDRIFQADGVHLNEYGYQIVGETLAGEFKIS